MILIVTAYHIENRSEDTSEDPKDRYVDYLAGRIANLDMDNRAMGFVLENFLKVQQQMQNETVAL